MSEPVPRSIWALALIGMLGFPISAALFVYGPAPYAERGLHFLLAWSAVMMGFLGGVRWSLESSRAIPRALRLGVAILPPLVGCGLLLARDYLELDWSLGGYLAAFLVAWLFDQVPETPSRFPRLMTILTFMACIGLAMALEKALRM